MEARALPLSSSGSGPGIGSDSASQSRLRCPSPRLVDLSGRPSGGLFENTPVSAGIALCGRGLAAYRKAIRKYRLSIYFY
jgi:hypothetical protein